MDATFDDLRVPLRGARGIGHVLEPARREQDGAERVANVVADDRENPPLEVAGERELLLIVLLLCLLSAAAKAVFHLERFAPVKMVTVQAAPTGDDGIGKRRRFAVGSARPVTSHDMDRERAPMRHW
jgi:hypothetical protein